MTKLASQPQLVDEVRVLLPQRSTLFMIVKRLVQTAFAICVLPRLFTHALARYALGERAFLAASESIAHIPGLRGIYLRQAFYRQTLAACGKDVHFGWHSVFSMPTACLGERVYIGRFCTIGFADIGDEVMLADHVQILSGGHEHGNADDCETMHQQAQTYRRVRIGRGAWIGAGAIIMADVGEGTVIGAGAVVTKPVPSHTVAVGVPAKTLRSPREVR